MNSRPPQEDFYWFGLLGFVGIGMGVFMASDGSPWLGLLFGLFGLKELILVVMSLFGVHK